MNVVLRVGEGARLKKQPGCLVELHDCRHWKSRLEEKSLKQQAILVVVAWWWVVCCEWVRRASKCEKQCAQMSG